MDNINKFMTFSATSFLTAGGLFDFDLTFVAETILFIILALVVTFVFLNPISKQLDDRAEFINFTLRKSTILLTLGYEKLSESIGLLTEEVTELNRQIKLTRSYTNSNFEEEVLSVQKQNSKLLSKLKGDLSIKSAYIFSNVRSELISLTDKFFEKKFQS
jgi:F0F1-type ATP synthase membrane subunit b/b'